MLRRVQFDGTNEMDKAHFTLLREAFLGRGSAKQEDRRSKDDHRSESRIKRAMDSISVPREVVGQEAPKPGAPDLRSRDLKEEKVTLTLEQPDFSRLQKYADETQWMPHVIDLAMDLTDRLDAAEKVEGESVPIPTLVPKGKAK